MDLKELPIEQIVVSEFNTRKDLAAGTEHSSIEDLANSIREKGLLSPIMVRVAPDGKYELIAGQRRLEACKRIGMSTIKAFVRPNTDDADATAISLIENVHRAEMNPMDKARALAALGQRYSGDVPRVSKATGIGAQTVRKYLALLALPETIQAKVSTMDGPAKVDTLSALARTFDDPEQMLEAYDKIANFKQETQKQILKASEGDISRIDELVIRAQEGDFNTKFCRGVAGKLMCDYVPEELVPKVMEMWEQWKKDIGLT